MIKFNYSVTTAPDFTGWSFFVETGREFDANDYASAYGLVGECDAASVHATQAAAKQLQYGEWLLVDHEIATTKTEEDAWLESQKDPRYYSESEAFEIFGPI